MENVHDELIEILSVMDEKEYPQSAGVISSWLDCEDFDDAKLLDLCCALHTTDEVNVMHPKIAALVREIYEYLIEERDCAPAMCNLGALYYSGRIGTQDFTKAVEYYTMAADRGDRQAQENLGYCYYYGRSVPVDYEKAYHYFVKGALDGHIRSLYKMGDMYRNGYYVKKDLNEAFAIYDRCYQTMTDEAAGSCGADVAMRMGDCFFYGIGVEQNYRTAFVFYQQAEIMYYDRINNGDYLVRGSLKHVLSNEDKCRGKLVINLPNFEWTE